MIRPPETRHVHSPGFGQFAYSLDLAIEAISRMRAVPNARWAQGRDPGTVHPFPGAAGRGTISVRARSVKRERRTRAAQRCIAAVRTLHCEESIRRASRIRRDKAGLRTPTDLGLDGRLSMAPLSASSAPWASPHLVSCPQTSCEAPLGGCSKTRVPIGAIAYLRRMGQQDLWAGLRALRRADPTRPANSSVCPTDFWERQ